MAIQETLSKIQVNLKAPKGQYNEYGKYKYRRKWQYKKHYQKSKST